ncbi:MAG: glycosyltransferase family 39 protein [Symploca sp. SIO2E6]|nr:glycosyltransferase family 39 protein [Symploca sp. SIO2E6]
MSKLALTFNRSLMRELPWFLGLLITAVVLWCIALGDLPLRDWDEGYYAIVSRDMYRSGNWLHPTYLGQPFLLKPPLMYWLVALSYHWGGVNEFTTRLPLALLSAVGVPLLYLLGREIFPQRLPSLLAALVYLTLLPVVRHTRLAMLDGMIVTLLLLLLLCILRTRWHRLWAMGIGISLGLMALTKGIIVLLLGAIAAAFILANGQLAILKNLYFWLGLLLGGVSVFAWYDAQWQHYGEVFLQVHFQAQGFNRISQAVWGNTGPTWYYLVELLKYSCPWLVFWPGGLYLTWQKRNTPWGMLVLLGTLIYLGAISVMRTKLPWYIIPLYPFFALAVAAQLAEFWENSRRYPGIIAGIFSLFSAASLGGLVYFCLVDPQLLLIIMGVVVALTMGLAAWQITQHNQWFIPILLAGSYLALALLMSSQSWIWELNEAFPVKPVAALIREKAKPGVAVYTSFDYGRPSLDFYSDRLVIPQNITALQQLWSTQPYLLLDQSALDTLGLPNSISLGTAEGFTLVAPEVGN